MIFLSFQITISVNALAPYDFTWPLCPVRRRRPRDRSRNLRARFRRTDRGGGRAGSEAAQEGHVPRPKAAGIRPGSGSAHREPVPLRAGDRGQTVLDGANVPEPAHATLRIEMSRINRMAGGHKYRRVDVGPDQCRTALGDGRLRILVRRLFLGLSGGAVLGTRGSRPCLGDAPERRVAGNRIGGRRGRRRRRAHGPPKPPGRPGYVISSYFRNKIS